VLEKRTVQSIDSASDPLRGEGRRMQRMPYGGNPVRVDLKQRVSCCQLITVDRIDYRCKITK